MSMDGCLAVSLLEDCQSDRLKVLQLRTMMVINLCQVWHNCCSAGLCQIGNICKYAYQLFCLAFENNKNVISIHAITDARCTISWWKITSNLAIIGSLCSHCELKWPNSVYQALCLLRFPTANGTVSFPKGYNGMGRQLVLLV